MERMPATQSGTRFTLQSAARVQRDWPSCGRGAARATRALWWHRDGTARTVSAALTASRGRNRRASRSAGGCTTSVFLFRPRIQGATRRRTPTTHGRRRPRPRAAAATAARRGHARHGGAAVVGQRPPRALVPMVPCEPLIPPPRRRGRPTPPPLPPTAVTHPTCPLSARIMAAELWRAGSVMATVRGAAGGGGGGGRGSCFPRGAAEPHRPRPLHPSVRARTGG